MKAVLEKAIEWIGRCVAWLAILMALITVVVVVRRYGFQSGGAIYLQESVVYMHAILFMLGLSYALKHDAHVRVDLIYSRVSPRRKALINLVGHVVFLIPMCLVIAFYSFDYVLSSWRVLEGSQEVGGIPGVFLLKTVIPLTALLLLVQSVLDVLDNIGKLRSK